ncbi:patellin-3-like [Silene latifolia]|uniref:patellin-3-like n=1 Tax=Silene latifolia TaxID=37657 RepID=UPI003D77FB2F
MASRQHSITEHQNKALEELKTQIQDAFKSHQLTSYEQVEATIWGVPLLGDRRSNTIILKFLKAKDFHVMDALSMIKDTLRWRAEVGVDTLLEEDLGNSFDRVLFTHGYDKEGYPIWYLALGELLNSMLCQTTSSDVENQHKFYCWLIQFVERNIKKLDFSRGGRNSFNLVIDLGLVSSWHGTRDLYKVIYKFLQLLHDHYPGFVEKQMEQQQDCNIYRRIQNSRDSFQECDVHWDLRVINWDIIYQAEFVPIAKGRYITVISKPRKLTPTDRPIISDSFRVSESGKLVLTIHNMNSKKKKLLARVRVVPIDGTKVADEASLRGWLPQPDESC